MFKKIINRLQQDERGVTGLETAIILIAFVVVASVFAYTVISAGLFSVQHVDEVVRSGIGTTQTTMNLRGEIIAWGHRTGGNVTHGNVTYVGRISFTVSNVLGEGQAIDLTPTHNWGANRTRGIPVGNLTPPLRSVTIISYDDANRVISKVDWTVEFAGGFDEVRDYLLETGETATITVWLPAGHLGTNSIFHLQVMPPQGATLRIQKRTPADLSDIMRL